MLLDTGEKIILEIKAFKKIDYDRKFLWQWAFIIEVEVRLKYAKFRTSFKARAVKNKVQTQRSKCFLITCTMQLRDSTFKKF